MRDRLERCALKLWRRWLRMARYALKTTRTDALLRYRIQNHQEVSKAVEDVLAGREGLVHMLVRARRTARSRMRARIESEVLRAAVSVGVGEGREAIARVVRRAGYCIGASTVQRVLTRRGMWPRSEGGTETRPHESRSSRPGLARCPGAGNVGKESER